MRLPREFIITAAVALLAIAAFWFVALAPKRQEASDLSKQADQLRVSIQEQNDLVTAALDARRNFPREYQQLVLLGKAVPEDDDSSSLLVQFDRIARHAHVQFRGIELGQAVGDVAPVTPAAPASGEPTVQEPPPEPGQPSENATTTEASSTTSAPATEAVASLLPIGASIGPAGLGVLPYKLQFEGEFFRVADFIQGLDRLVDADGSHVAVDGRLVTIDGFSLARDPKIGFPSLKVSFAVTTYLTPAGQSLTGGATPTAPAPVSSETQATPTSTPVSP